MERSSSRTTATGAVAGHVAHVPPDDPAALFTGSRPARREPSRCCSCLSDSNPLQVDIPVLRRGGLPDRGTHRSARHEKTFVDNLVGKLAHVAAGGTACPADSVDAPGVILASLISHRMELPWPTAFRGRPNGPQQAWLDVLYRTSRRVRRVVAVCNSARPAGSPWTLGSFTRRIVAGRPSHVPGEFA